MTAARAGSRRAGRRLAWALAGGLAGLSGAQAGPAPFCVDQPAPDARPDLSPLAPVGTPEGPAAGAWTWVNLWATWCEPCRTELPLLRQWQATLGGPSALRLVFISVDEGPEAVAAALAGLGLAGSWHAPLPIRSAVTRSLGLDGGSLPTHVLLDPAGRPVCVHEDSVQADQWPQVQARLAARPQSAPAPTARSGAPTSAAAPARPSSHTPSPATPTP